LAYLQVFLANDLSAKAEGEPSVQEYVYPFFSSPHTESGNFAQLISSPQKHKAEACASALHALHYSVFLF
jgi:hypothetical protein